MPLISTLWVDVEARGLGAFKSGMGIVGTAVVAVGAIATKMALDYDNAFTKISAVSNASAADIERWRGEVLKMAGATAQAPKDLADALFFLASAGLKTSQIMPVLEASAKASASGLGEVADIAKLTSNVLNAYAGTGLEAARVTDVLVAAVREGSANTDEFGTAIGRILPIASAAGIGFDSVAASLSSLSNIGLDVNEGVTAMRGLFQALVSPTDAAATAMATVGLSAQDLLDSLQKDGLIATIRLLDTAVKNNTTSQSEYMGVLRDIVPNVRSLTGLLGLTTQEAERVNSIFKRVRESTGSLDKAFQETSDSAGFKLKKALNDLKIIAIQLGDKILPVVVAVVEGAQKEFAAWAEMIQKVAHFFNDLGHEIADAVREMVQDLKNLWGHIKDVFFGAPDLLVDAGRNLILGLWNGIRSMFSTVWNGLTSWVSGLVDHVKSFLHIGSPSKVFEDIGQNMMAGMDEGLRSGWKSVEGTMGGFNGSLAGSSFAVGGTSAVSGDIVLQVDGQTFARIARSELLKLKGSRVSLGLS